MTGGGRGRRRHGSSTRELDGARRLALRGAPPATTPSAPHVVEGRWLAAGDADGVVLNTSARALAFRDAHVGDTITLSIADRPAAVVGMIDETLTPGAAYVVRDLRR